MGCGVWGRDRLDHMPRGGGWWGVGCGVAIGWGKGGGGARGRRGRNAGRHDIVTAAHACEAGGVEWRGGERELSAL